MLEASTVPLPATECLRLLYKVRGEEGPCSHATASVSRWTRESHPSFREMPACHGSVPCLQPILPTALSGRKCAVMREVCCVSVSQALAQPSQGMLCAGTKMHKGSVGRRSGVWHFCKSKLGEGEIMDSDEKGRGGSCS